VELFVCFCLKRVQDGEDEDGSECLLSFIAQLHPGGWIWESFGYQQAFLKEVRTLCVTGCNPRVLTFFLALIMD
jgi:hypothetical protein